MIRQFPNHLRTQIGTGADIPRVDIADIAQNLLSANSSSSPGRVITSKASLPNPIALHQPLNMRHLYLALEEEDNQCGIVP
jgi:hypothetical protein